MLFYVRINISEGIDINKTISISLIIVLRFN